MTKRTKGVLAFLALALIAGVGTLYLIFYTVYVKPVQPEVGTSEDLVMRTEALAKADSAALMVVTVKETGDFVQLIPSETGLRLIYPMATDRQRRLAPAMRKALTAAGCVVEDVPAGDVAFLEADLVGDAKSAADTLGKILGSAFGVTPETELVFDHAGLDH